MTTRTLKKQLHQAIDDMPDAGFLKAVHALFKEYPVRYDHGFELSEEEKKQLDEQKKLYVAGKTKSYSVSEVRKRAIAQLKK
ncbi:MAG TPA: hypothetical protein VGO45_13500 [Bacteroidia bacterium]|jgi:hypothetical protein|nr:hypothetical protein [Bacteroidia bacterium]